MFMWRAVPGPAGVWAWIVSVDWIAGGSSDVETQIAMSRGRLGHVNSFDARSRGTVPDAMLEALERLRLTFGLDFNSPVWDVADPAVHALMNGRGLREEPEPDSLDAAADEIPSREAHAGKARDYIPLAATSSLRCSAGDVWSHSPLLERRDDPHQQARMEHGHRRCGEPWRARRPWDIEREETHDIVRGEPLACGDQFLGRLGVMSFVGITLSNGLWPSRCSTGSPEPSSTRWPSSSC